jgi:hypothetical protein
MLGRNRIWLVYRIKLEVETIRHRARACGRTASRHRLHTPTTRDIPSLGRY